MDRLQLFFVLLLFLGWSSQDCPCSNVTLCNPLTIGNRKEMYAFQTNINNWKMYNWDELTTVALFDGLDNDMLCYAHSKEVRVVWEANYPTDQLTNETYQDEWVNNWVQKVQDTYTDGVNVDYESPINQTDQINGYTQLIQKLTDAIHSNIPGSQVTADVAWSPDCIDGRCYDYAGVANASDFVIVMDYDERSQIFEGPPCYAGPNSPITGLNSGMQAFFELGIPKSKLVMGIPWYGYKYPCSSPPDGSGACEIESVPFRGVACSDAAGSEVCYSGIETILNSSGATVHYTKEASPYFNVVDDSGAVTQYWFDNPASLAVKYEYAVQENLRGMAMWNIDCLDYFSTNPVTQQQTARMWNVFNTFFAQLKNQ
uniref:GH18 domain-containing protein n=1 Tax=Paramoeba aestuarina TaxID=180227 RepID=A0A6U2XID5_9EUKA